MDVDFWSSRVHSAKHLSAAQLAARYTSDNHLAIDDSDGDEDARAYFPCPFCYVEIEIHILCGHLQDEHCFDLKNAVCPLCAGNLGKDVIGHFIVHHASSLKRRRKSLKSGLWTAGSGMISKELSSFLWSSTNGRGYANEAAPDLLLSPFLGSIPNSHPEGSQQDESFKNTAYLKGCSSLLNLLVRDETRPFASLSI
ncbi:protein DEHYDRATION-INDUCED 19 homolog 5-like isoform X2 [Euphorbia lathyris]|uniref:protein DEHYDRATION-INDUCED 19 homolog 5-like isoform X2 n=1 Tax=Euphorbia lathyris TaxID=212925 RepID=UPI003313C911